MLKISKAIGFALFTISLLTAIIISEIKNVPAVSSLCGLVTGFVIPLLWNSIQDLSDKDSWRASQRKLLRGGIITKETIVRVSFAYLFRIKIGNKYLLVKNERGTKKFQPVGGVYHMFGNEKAELQKLFHIIDDSKIAIDISSKSDYRIQMQNRYLRKFVKRFDKEADRENVLNLGREFREEIVDTNILKWNHIKYRFCGRHMSDLSYSAHFRCYELLLADIVELIPTDKQNDDLSRLIDSQSDRIRFATPDEIKSLGVKTDEGLLEECIADHAQKILQENEVGLIKMPYNDKQYSVDL